MHKDKTKLSETLGSDKIRYGLFCAFLILTFLFGGGSRGDISSLMLLRPIAIVAAALLFIFFVQGNISRLGLPFYLLLALMALIAIQLVPLPPVVWESFPGRSIFAEIAILSGIDKPWRPISLVPSRTLNSFFALSVPVATFLFMASLWKIPQLRIAALILVLGIFSAIFGLLQILGPPDGALYTYSITNNGDPVGFFSNRNHQGVFLATLFLLVAYIVIAGEKIVKDERIRQFIGLSIVLFLMLLIIMTGSRAGTAMGVLAIIIYGILVSRYPISPGVEKSKNQKSFSQKKWVPPTILAISIVGIFALSFYFSRTAAFDRLFDADPVEEARYQTLPYLIELLWAYFPIGSGFGSFEFIYRTVEPIDLLSKSYLNQAHNDWLQIAIEGGVAAVAIATIFGIWLVHGSIKVISNFRDAKRNSRESHRCLLGVVSVLIVFMILVSSLFDYIVRTPIGSAYLVILCCWIQRCISSDPETTKRFDLPG